MNPHTPHSLLTPLQRIFAEERRRQAPDGDLLRAFVQRREGDAFAELLRRHGPMVLRLGLHVLHHQQDAEDVFQATFLTLARKASSLRNESCLAGWLHRVAWRLALRSREARRTAGVSQLVAAHQPAEDGRSPDPADEISLREAQALLHQELAALPERLRLPLVLCYLQGRTRDEAASQLGWSLGTLKRRLEQGRKLLHARLSRRGVALPAVLSAALLGAAAVPASLAASTLGLAVSSLTGSASLPASVAVLLAKASWSVKARAVWGLLLMLGACAGAWVSRGQIGDPAAPPEAPPASSPAAAIKGEKPSEPPRDRFGDPLPAGAVARLGTVRMRHAHLISGAEFSRDGKSIIVSDCSSGVHVWDVADGKEVRRFCTDVNHCEHLALSPDGRTLAVALGNKVQLCDPRSGRELASLPEENVNGYGSLAFSDDSSLLSTVIVYKKSVRIWDVASRRLVREATFPEYVGNVAFSSDGKLLVCDVGRIVCLWDLAQGKEVRRLRNDSGSLAAIFAPKGGPLAVWGYGDRSVRLFDANGIKEIRRFKAESAEQMEPSTPYGWAHDMRARFSPNGKILAIFRDLGRIELWDVESGKMLHTLACDRSHTPSFLVFSPDGTKLASAGGDLWRGDNVVRLWDVAQGKEIHPLFGHGSAISSVAISPDGNSIATAGQDGLIHLWHSSSGKHLFRLEGHPGKRPQAAFSSDGRRVIWWGDFDGDGTLRIWDSRTGQAVRRLKLRAPDVYWQAVSDNGKTAFSIEWKGKSVLRLHDLATGKVTREVADSSFADTRPIAFSPAGDQMLCSDGILRIARDRKEIVQVGRIGEPNPSVRFSADGRRLVAAVVEKRLEMQFQLSNPPAGEIAVIDPLEGKELRRFGKKNVGSEFYKCYLIDAATLSRDGKMVVTALRDGRQYNGQTIITLWETETGRERGHFLGHRGPTNSIAISADGRFLVTGANDTTALVWDATKPQTWNAFPRREAAALDLAAHFKYLAGKDAEQAYASMWALINVPQKTVSFLGEQSSLFARTDVHVIQRWIRDLDSSDFAERERASQELARILDEAEARLKKALQSRPSLELRRRIDLLLEERSRNPTGNELQRLRVIEMLEHIAAAGADATRRAAIALLTKLAAGAAEARPTQEAKASLERLERRADSKP